MESTNLTSSIFTFLIVLFAFFLMGTRIVFDRKFIMPLLGYIKKKLVRIKQACSELSLSDFGNNKDQGVFYESKPATSQK
jgi:hypothetical protein